MAIRDHFERLPPEPEAQIHSVADLGRTIEIYSALVGAGDLDAASTLYLDRLAHPLYDRISAFPTIVELLTPLFPDGLHRLPRLSSYRHKSALITDLANALALVGRDPEATVLRELSIRLDLTRRHPCNVVISLLNWALSLEDDGRTHAALRTFDLAHRLAVAADRKRSDVPATAPSCRSNSAGGTRPRPTSRRSTTTSSTTATASNSPATASNSPSTAARTPNRRSPPHGVPSSGPRARSTPPSCTSSPVA
ncbi:hypothetical protein OV079_51255 [Nannocystis pusilla]|uniref:Uncharacterized protein n=1 Tax=Nannocystis pusilla TaxID=889268 RepID=A0A9X3F1S8_9BACT|nr:hypothetical protein [Nannocystis pusilla]MCY1013770.1 hypothetical protein [Nannocystis pusilla]